MSENTLKITLNGALDNPLDGLSIRLKISSETI